MMDALVEVIPWEKVGEAAFGVCIAALAALGIDVTSRWLTGKGIFKHLRNFSVDIEERLRKWLQQQRVDGVVINKLVFVFECVNSFLTTAQKGMDYVIVKIFGETDAGRRVNTGKRVIMRVTMEKAKELASRREIEAGLNELGLAF